MKATLPLTPSQTVGPFFTIAMSNCENEGRLSSPVGNEISGMGEPVILVGRVFDGEQNMVPDALIEIFQADAAGSFTNPDFLGFARSHTGNNTDGYYLLKTIKPGATGSSAAPYISAIVYMRGLLTHVYTRIYFSDEIDANAEDAILAQIDDGRRDTLIAQRNDSDGVVTYEFNIHMQGDKETVFFSI
ncbi:MAG: protocatechuate 3,4-dioxygenase subunit alpha [Gammaproteobacteria bacterium]|nr:protocatechuate 3,4-dioxygenase subunit alpha [Gammaproteobacteria bacterium]MDD9895119.1 protocatechuate 3,4-dioxygenase subunit alpha [Gammaproteobacteria bacterium]MDD9959501.1 protocatechuate 3,4-dioxygenase subunit alpha [Gammaproteobacteria bacterium]